MSPRHRPFFIALVLLGASGARGDGPEKAPGLTDEQKGKNLESFEVVWKTIRDTHFDPKLGGLDWKAVHDELKPRVEKAATMAEARAAMTEMLGRLKQTHFGILASEALHEADDSPGGDGQPGFDIRLVEGRVLVTAVDPGSPAEKAGVKPAWIVEKIRGKPVDELLAAAAKAYAKAGLVPVRQILTLIRRLEGPPGSTVGVDFLDSRDQPVHLDLKLDKPKGTAAHFGNLPTYYVHFLSKRIGGSIAYVALNAFFDPSRIIGQFASALKENRDAEGLILDLRGNPGGIGAMAMGMGGWLVSDADRKLGTMITRAGSLHFTLNPRPEPFTRPVAVIVDELSMSTSEILAGGLKDIKRARIFGVRTPGAALPSRVDVLPNGDGFQYAFANYISAGGKPLEGNGVEPDVETPLTRAALLEGHDPAVEAAVAWIRSQVKKP
ncbi:MAG TPA: S41 family peptidase [Isosphaeraceae bacterium]